MAKWSRFHNQLTQINRQFEPEEPGDLASALGQLLAHGGPHDATATVNLGDGFVLDDYLNRLQSPLLQRALQQAKGNKAKAARLLGIENYQTLAA